MRITQRIAGLAAACAVMAAGAIMAPAAMADGCTLGVSTIAECFPDTVLARAVADAVHAEPTDMLSASAADSLTSLQLDEDDKALTSLQGVNVLHNLQSLSIAQTDATTLAGIEDSPKLAVLRIDRAEKLTDVDAVRSVPNLREVTLSYAPLTGVSAFHDMPNLEQLTLTHNRISGFDPLVNLPKLWSLNVTDQETEISVSLDKNVDLTIPAPSAMGRRADTITSITEGGVYNRTTGRITWPASVVKSGEFKLGWQITDITPYKTGMISGSLTIKVTIKGETKPDPEPTDMVNVYRLLNTRTGRHLYTTDENERAVLSAGGVWRDEAIAFRQPKTGAPVYRLARRGEHHWTASLVEYTALINHFGWTGENVAWHMDNDGPVAVYRLRSLKNGEHLYTKDFNEYQVLDARADWIGEGIAWHTR